MLAKIDKLLKPVSKLMSNKYAVTYINIILILYASMVAPKLPSMIKTVLMSKIGQIIILALIALVGNNSPSTSLLMAIGFIVSMMALNKLETIKGLDKIINRTIDIPQNILNKVVDGSQDIVEQGASMIGGPLPMVANTANEIIDTVQEIANNGIDKIQEIVIGKEEEQKETENFSMKDRKMDLPLPDANMGNLGDLSGFDASVTGAAPVSEEPQTEGFCNQGGCSL
jgi:hypothetical protein